MSLRIYSVAVLGAVSLLASTAWAESPVRSREPAKQDVSATSRLGIAGDEPIVHSRAEQRGRSRADVKRETLQWLKDPTASGGVRWERGQAGPVFADR